MDTTIDEAMDHDVPTKEVRLTLEVPETANLNELENDAVRSLPAVKSTTGCVSLCPTCGEPYEARLRLGYKHPVSLDEVDQVCMGYNRKGGNKGGLAWLYAHGGSISSTDTE